MIYSVSCSWCSTPNDSKERVCKTCGHNPLLAKADCECAACVGLFADKGPVPLPDPYAKKPRKRRPAPKKAKAGK